LAGEREPVMPDARATRTKSFAALQNMPNAPAAPGQIIRW
jgi:hypothetical protein